MPYINDKKYLNLPQQVKQNKDDIVVLQEKVTKNEEDIELIKDNTQVENVMVQIKTLDKVTVGSSGDYATINEAILYFTAKYPNYISNTVIAEIELQIDFVMKEQILVEALNLGWIKITALAAEVVIDRAYLTESIELPSYDGVTAAITSYPAFGGVNGAVLPKIDVLFSMNTNSVATNRDGIFIGRNSSVSVEKDCGVKNAGSRGLYAVHNSRATIPGTIFTGSLGNGISIFRQSFVDFRGGTVANAALYGIYVDSASVLEANNLVATGCLNGVYIDDGSTAAIPSCDLSNATQIGLIVAASIVDARECTINDCGQRGINAIKGAIVNANDSTITGSGTDGVYSADGSNVNVSDCTITGSTGKGIYALNGGKITAKNTNAQRGAGESTDDIRVLYGGIIIANNATGGLGGATANVLTANGIIFTDDTPVTPDGAYGDDTNATFENDFSGTLLYSKTSNGTVWIRGIVTIGTIIASGTKICTLETEFRPPYTTNCELITGAGVHYQAHISSSGGLFLAEAVPASGTLAINLTYHE